MNNGSHLLAHTHTVIEHALKHSLTPDQSIYSLPYSPSGLWHLLTHVFILQSLMLDAPFPQCHTVHLHILTETLHSTPTGPY